MENLIGEISITLNGEVRKCMLFDPTQPGGVDWDDPVSMMGFKIEIRKVDDENQRNHSAGAS